MVWVFRNQWDGAGRTRRLSLLTDPPGYLQPLPLPSPMDAVETRPDAFALKVDASFPVTTSSLGLREATQLFQ